MVQPLNNAAYLDGTGSVDTSGNWQLASTANPLPVSVLSGGGSNASVGVIGTTAPSSVTLIGYEDASGLTQIDSDATPHPVTSNTPRGTYTSRSGTVTTGGTSQQIMAVNANRKSIIIENPIAATETLFFNFTSAASTTTDSIGLAPGGIYSPTNFISTEAINVTATTTGHAFVAKEG